MSGASQQGSGSAAAVPEFQVDQVKSFSLSLFLFLSLILPSSVSEAIQQGSGSAAAVPEFQVDQVMSLFLLIPFLFLSFFLSP